MLRIAQILWGKAHWITEMEEIPDWPPDPEGNKIVFVDITEKPEVQEGWDYDAETGIFTAPPEPEVVEYKPMIAPTSLEESVQATMYLAATNDIQALQDQPQGVGVSMFTFNADTHSPRYEFWRNGYFRDHVNKFTLEKLVEGGVLQQEEIETIIADRLEKFGV